MDTATTNLSGAQPSGCTSDVEEALNLFVDGELALGRQAGLFAHLAACEDCRRVLDGVMNFRRFSREEHLPVPPMVDDAFMKRLAQAKVTGNLVNRSADRRPLWHARTAVTLRSAVVAGVMVFIAGLLLPLLLKQQAVIGLKEQSAAPVHSTEERVELPAAAPLNREAILYVFYPGVTVEAAKLEEEVSPGPL